MDLLTNREQKGPDKFWDPWHLVSHLAGFTRCVFSVVFRHGSLAEPCHGHLHPGAPVMPESSVPAWKYPHVDPEAPAFSQLLASPESSVSLN